MNTSTAYFKDPEIEVLFNPNDLRNVLSPDNNEEGDEEEYDEYELLESVIRPVSYPGFNTIANGGR